MALAYANQANILTERIYIKSFSTSKWKPSGLNKIFVWVLSMVHMQHEKKAQKPTSQPLGNGEDGKIETKN